MGPKCERLRESNQVSDNESVDSWVTVDSVGPDDGHVDFLEGSDEQLRRGEFLGPDGYGTVEDVDWTNLHVRHPREAQPFFSYTRPDLVEGANSIGTLPRDQYGGVTRDAAHSGPPTGVPTHHGPPSAPNTTSPLARATNSANSTTQSWSPRRLWPGRASPERVVNTISDLHLHDDRSSCPSAQRAHRSSNGSAPGVPTRHVRFRKEDATRPKTQPRHGHASQDVRERPAQHTYPSYAPAGPSYVSTTPNHTLAAPSYAVYYPPQSSYDHSVHSSSAQGTVYYPEHQQQPPAACPPPVSDTRSHGTPWLPRGSRSRLQSSASHIDAKTAESALRGEFVQLEDFLYNVNVEYDELKVVDNYGNIQLKPSKPRKVITSFFKWLEAWGCYESLLVGHYGYDMYEEMSQYRSFMLRLTDKYKMPFILNYDERNRSALGRVRSFEFASFNQELFVTTFTAMALKNVNRCTKCSSPDHGANECPFRSGNQGGGTSQGTSEPTKKRIDPNEICIKFQDGTCRFKKCPRKHACMFCKGNTGAMFCSTCPPKAGGSTSIS